LRWPTLICLIMLSLGAQLLLSLWQFHITQTYCRRCLVPMGYFSIKGDFVRSYSCDTEAVGITGQAQHTLEA
jgi:hypothetical protein